MFSHISAQVRKDTIFLDKSGKPKSDTDKYWSYKIYTYVDGVFKNPVCTYLPNGTLYSKKFCSSVEPEEIGEGNYLTFYKNGTGNVVGKYVNDKTHGTWKSYYETGELKSTHEYLDGFMTGYRNNFYKNGKIYMSHKYLNNKKHGNCKDYFENGQLRLDANYNMGTPDGQWLTYTKEGNLLYFTSFKNGYCKIRVYYFNNSKQINVIKTYAQKGRQIQILTYYENGIIKQIQTQIKKSKKFIVEYYKENGELEKIGKYNNGRFLKWIEQ